MRKNKKQTAKRICNKQKPKIIANNLVSIIILADLPGHRMRSYGPTPLINLGNKHLIDIQIDCIKKTFEQYEIIVCVGFDSDKVTKHIRNKYKNINIRIVENQLFNHSNTCESLRLSINNTHNNKILIIDGGLLFNKKVLNLIDINDNSAIIEKSPSENLEIGVNINSEHESQHFSFGGYRTWSEMIYLKDSEIIECLRKFLNHADSKKKFIFEGLNDVLRHGHLIKCVENPYALYKINNIKTFHYIKDNYEVFNL